MKKLAIDGLLEVDDSCSLSEAILRLSIRLKQMSQGEMPPATDWQGSVSFVPSDGVTR